MFDPLVTYMPEEGSRRATRRSRRKRVGGGTEQHVQQPWHEDIGPLHQLRAWRHSSPTYRSLRKNVEGGMDVFKRGLQEAQETKDAVIEALRAQLRIARHNLKRASESLQTQPARRGIPDSSDVARLLGSVGHKQDSRAFAVGTLLFGALAFVAGAAPWALPTVYLCFLACALPWRVWDFGRKKGVFFLLDFCYWANLAAAAFLLLAPQNLRWEGVIYALADGPLAGALLVWQSAWVFGSASHSISVLIHLLPGLAIWAHRHFPVPPAVAAGIAHALARIGLSSAVAAEQPPPHQQRPGWALMLGGPLLFYAAWQLAYWLIVQVCCSSYIKRRGYLTSYSSLAGRAQRQNNVWNRLVRRGSHARRVCMFGLLQLVFTLGCVLLVQPLYKSFALSLVWQVLKIVFPVYNGARYQCEKKARHRLQAALKQYTVTAKNPLQSAPSAPAQMPQLTPAMHKPL